MIRVGIVGCNYGLNVLAPAFRLDRRCIVAGLAGREAERTGNLARQNDIERAFADWTELIDCDAIDAIAIATPPRLQPEIALRALGRGKAVFAEKPMASNLADAAAMLQAAAQTPTMIDFGFSELPAWRKAKTMLDDGAIGRLRHVAVGWYVENAATRLRLQHWKTSGMDGGGALGNLGSHAMHYLEWFCGPIAGLWSRLAALPDAPNIETSVTLALSFASGAAGSFSLSSASYRGTGHRLEFYGDDGMLVLANPTQDYMRGFDIVYARRPEGPSAIAVAPDPRDAHFPNEARIAPVSRLAGQFLDAIEAGRPAVPGFAEGYRTQVLLDAVRRSHASGRWLELPTPDTAGAAP